MNENNYKINWELILKREIDYLSKKFPDLDVKNNYQNIIDLLNNNKIKYKIMLNKNDFIGYAYIMDSVEKSDRLYADIGFISSKKINEVRLKEFFDWIADIAKKSGKKLMLNPVFNGNDLTEKYLENIGFKKIVRKRMVIDLNEYKYNSIEINYNISGIKDINEDLYADAEYESFKYTPDKILFSNKREDRLKSVHSLFDGEYGEILNEASLIIKNKGRIIAALISAQLGFDRAFIVSLFVKREYRKKGIGKYLLLSALNRLKALSFHYVFLWVNNENFAKDFYLKNGFKLDNYPEEIIYYLNYKK